METLPQPAEDKPPVLSSDMTFFHKFALPAPFIFISSIVVSSAVAEGGLAWIFALFWTAACLALLVWTSPMKFVEIKGDQLSVSNSIKTHLVPARDLYFIDVDRDVKTPSITLYFNPPTPFGKSIRILPPKDRKRVSFDRAARWLQSQPNCRSSHPF